MDSSDADGSVEFVMEENDDGASDMGSESTSRRDTQVDSSVYGSKVPVQPKSGESLVSSSLSKLDVLADQSLTAVSLTGKKLMTESRSSELRAPSDSRISPAWPVSSLREGRLLQHFITHLAPWVGSQSNLNYFRSSADMALV